MERNRDFAQEFIFDRIRIAKLVDESRYQHPRTERSLNGAGHDAKQSLGSRLSSR